jgi:hypothetical protein
MIKENSDTQLHREAKSQLARLMANENLTVEHRAVRTAYFDVENRLLVLPIWKNMTGNIYDTLVGHEVGHALDTPPSADILKNAIESIDAKNPRGSKMFLNVVEDARIEKLVRRRYPGMRRSFSLGYKELLDRNFFGTAGRSIKSYKLIDRINLHLKLGSAMIIDFTPAERKLVEMAENCETFQDVVNTAQAIYKYCAESGDDNQNAPSPFDQETETEFYPDEDGDYEMEYDGESDEDFEPSDSENDSENAETDDSDESKNGAGDDDSDDESDSEDHEDEDDSDHSSFANDQKDAFKQASSNSPNDLTSETQESWEEKKDDLIKQDGVGYLYTNIPEIDGHKWVIPHKQIHEGGNGFVGLSEIAMRGGRWGYIPSASRETVLMEANKFRSENTAVISYMVKEFEMRKAADLYSRSSIAKTGVINTNKLHTYKYNDDLFKRITNVPSGKNHGLVMFIDWSGSMTSSIAGLIEQLINMVLFCKRVQIPFDVYAFTNSYQMNNQDVSNNINVSKHDYKKGDLIVNPHLALLQLLSSSMKSIEFNQAIGNLLMFRRFFKNTNDSIDGRPFNFGSTPLDSAILCATSIVNAFRTKYKLQIVNTVILTDGDCTDDPDVFDTPWNRWNQRLVVRDTVTKSEHVIEDVWNKDSVTSIFLNHLRERTGTNVIGYYLHSGKARPNTLAAYFADPVELEKQHNNFLKNKYAEITTRGYSVYYIIKAEEMIIRNDELILGKATTAKSIAKVFAKYSKNKMDNRIVLSRFIEKISA